MCGGWEHEWKRKYQSAYFILDRLRRVLVRLSVVSTLVWRLEIILKMF